MGRPAVGPSVTGGKEDALAILGLHRCLKGRGTLGGNLWLWSVSYLCVPEPGRLAGVVVGSPGCSLVGGGGSWLLWKEGARLSSSLPGEASQGWLGLEPTCTPEASLLPQRGRRRKGILKLNWAEWLSLGKGGFQK